MLPLNSDEHLLLFGIMTLVVVASNVMEKRLLRGALSSAIYCLLTGLLLSNVGVMPFAAPVYGFINSYLLIIAIPLLLMRANLREVIREGGVVLKVFAVGAVGTVVGALLAVSLIDLGDPESKIAGMFVGTFIGGSVNFVSVSEIVQLDPSLFAASVAADVVVGTAAMVFLIAAPSIALIRRIFGYRRNVDEATGKSDRHPVQEVSFSMQGLAVSLAIALTICVVGQWLANVLNTPSMVILYITAFTLAVGNLLPNVVKKARGDADIGLFMMYLFFVVIGAQSDLLTILEYGLEILWFTAIIVLTHFVFALLGGKLMGVPLPETLIGSSACVLGPAPALAQAVSEGWEELKAPAALMGVFGYSIGTFLGVAFFKFFS